MTIADPQSPSAPKRRSSTRSSYVGWRLATIRILNKSVSCWPQRVSPLPRWCKTSPHNEPIESESVTEGMNMATIFEKVRNRMLRNKQAQCDATVLSARSVFIQTAHEELGHKITNPISEDKAFELMEGIHDDVDSRQ